jgi:hypothetical protein
MIPPWWVEAGRTRGYEILVVDASDECQVIDIILSKGESIRLDQPNKQS